MGKYLAKYVIPLNCEEDFIHYLKLNKIEYKELERDDKNIYMVINDEELGHMDNEDVLNDLIVRNEYQD